MQPEICIGGGGGQSWQVSNINLPNTMQNKPELRRIFQNNRIGNEASQIPKFPYWNYFQHSAMEMFIQVAQLMVFNDCGEMFSTGQQCQLLELLLRLDWKAKDTDKRRMYLEFLSLWQLAKNRVWSWVVTNEVVRKGWRCLF